MTTTLSKVHLIRSADVSSSGRICVYSSTCMHVRWLSEESYAGCGEVHTLKLKSFSASSNPKTRRGLIWIIIWYININRKESFNLF